MGPTDFHLKRTVIAIKCITKGENATNVKKARATKGIKPIKLATIASCGKLIYNCALSKKKYQDINDRWVHYD
jgi:hypothetical protein